MGQEFRAQRTHMRLCCKTGDAHKLSREKALSVCWSFPCLVCPPVILQPADQLTTVSQLLNPFWEYFIFQNSSQWAQWFQCWVRREIVLISSSLLLFLSLFFFPISETFLFTIGTKLGPFESESQKQDPNPDMLKTNRSLIYQLRAILSRLLQWLRLVFLADLGGS